MKTKGCMYVVKTASGLTNLTNYQTEFSPSSTMYAWTNAQIDIEHLDKFSKGVKFNDTKENTFYLCGSEVWFKFILQVVIVSIGLLH